MLRWSTQTSKASSRRIETTPLLIETHYPVPSDGSRGFAGSQLFKCEIELSQNTFTMLFGIRIIPHSLVILAVQYIKYQRGRKS